jgi:hypothetical protein
VVVREAHKVEKEQNIVEAIERLVSLLQGEEGHDTRRQEVEELVKKGEEGVIELGESEVVEI